METKNKIFLIFWVYLFSAIWGVMESENFLWLSFNGSNSLYDWPYHREMLLTAFIIVLVVPLLTGQKRDLLFSLGAWHVWSFVEDSHFLLHRVLFHGLDPLQIPFMDPLANSLGIVHDLPIPIWYITHPLTIILCFGLWFTSSTWIPHISPVKGVPT